MKVALTVISLFVAQLVFGQELNDQYVRVFSQTEGKVKDNQMVEFRISEDLKVKDIIIPKNTFFYAAAKFTGNRAFFEVDKISYNGKTYALKLSIVAKDLKEGLLLDKGPVVYMFNTNYQFLFKE